MEHPDLRVSCGSIAVSLLYDVAAAVWRPRCYKAVNSNVFTTHPAGRRQVAVI
jgi:hypothetical protein